MSSEQVYNISEASRLTGYSIPTIRGKLPQLKKLGAIQRGKGWAIPESALYGAGLMLKVDSKPLYKVANETLQADTSDLIKTLQTDLAEALRRAEVAEAVSRERERLIMTQAQALRMLEASPAVNRPRWRIFRARRESFDNLPGFTSDN
jgi:hypothetical protein